MIKLKLKFKFEIEVRDDITQRELERFMEHARLELSFLAYGQPCKLIDELYVFPFDKVALIPNTVK